jgi:Carboxypeptidase regulatory-like domain
MMVAFASVLTVAVTVVLGQAPAPTQAARIAGRVVAADSGLPLPDARVTLAPFVVRRGGAGPAVLQSGPPPQAITDQDGRFVFEGVAPGTYTFDAQHSGYASLRNIGGGPPQTIQLAPGQSIDSLELRLQRGSVIAGRVFGPSGEPLADVRVVAMRRVQTAGSQGRLLPIGSQGPQQTNDLGEFRIGGLPAGEYIVAAVRSPSPALPLSGASRTRQGRQTTIATTYYPGTTDQNGASPIAVGAGAEVGNITFTVQSVLAYHVSGVVVDENGAALAGAMVMLTGDPRNGPPIGPAGSARTAADGSFSIGEVPPGSYRLNATVPVVWNSSGSIGGGLVTAASAGRPSPPQQTEVVVADADVSGLQVVVRGR